MDVNFHLNSTAVLHLLTHNLNITAVHNSYDYAKGQFFPPY